MSMSDNPFAPPKAAVLEADSDDAFVAEGRKVPAGRGTAWVGESWVLYKRAPLVWIVMFVIFMVMTVVLAIIPLGSIVSSMLYPVFAAGFMLGCRELENGGKLEVAHLFAGFKANVGNLILVGLIYLAGAMVVAVIAGIGLAISMPFYLGGNFDVNADMLTMALAMAPLLILFVLVVMALSLPLVMALWFAPPLVVFHNLAPLEAMKASFTGCARNIWPFLIYGLVFLLLLIVAMIPLGLGLLVVSPMIWASIYTAYRDIYLAPK
ncbi:hypothetical protein DSM104443_03952 [Usitatibacter rugosus]|uniref:Transmembrane protein n=2 Tax=Usitatibacter rugosus TaxID=2732067 RepID=A0A6M4H134_9PROT|nr:hypothetical protein DSM104443_03952 [Usitatibacter rugosus]